MLNFYQLIDLIGPDTIPNIDKCLQLKDAFFNDWRDIFEGLQINKTTRARALDQYMSSARVMRDRECEKMITDGASIMYLPGPDHKFTPDGLDTVDLYQHFAAGFKDQRPAVLHLKETTACARALGWKPGMMEPAYHVEIDGQLYAWHLIYKCYSIIAENGKNGRDPMEVKTLAMINEPRRRALFINSKYGSAYILPLCFDTLYHGYNVNYDHAWEVTNRLYDLIKADAVKTA